MKDKKAQSAIELVMLVGAVFIFFLVFLFAIQVNTLEKTKEKRDFAFKELALTIQNEIDLASKSSDGYYREFEIPINLLGLEYEVKVTEGIVYLRSTNNRHAIVLPVAEVNGNAKLGTNIIRKEAGEVYLNS